MRELTLLSDFEVLLMGANVAVASVLVAFAGVSLRRCLAGRSLPLQHGALAASVGVLLLAPVCLVLSAGVPGIGIRWPAAATDSVGVALGDAVVPQDSSESPAEDSVSVFPVDTQALAIPPADVGIFNVDSNAAAAGTEWTASGDVVDERAAPAPEGLSQTSETAVADTETRISPVAIERVAVPALPIGGGGNTDVRRSNASLTTATTWSFGEVGYVLLLVWAVVAAIGLVRCVHGFVLVARLRRRAEVVSSPEIESLMSSVSGNVGLRRVPPVLQTEQVDVPLTLGLFRPAIVLPSELLSATSETKLRAILLHEAAHVARRDLWVGVLQRLTSSFYWWNPLVHVINRHLNDVRESLCDNHVLLAGGDERDYADTLLTLAARIARPSRITSAVGLVGRPSPGLSGRVTHLLEKDRDMSTRLTAGSRKLLLVIAAGAMFVLPLAAVRGPDSAQATETDDAADVRDSDDRRAGSDMLPPQDPIGTSGVAALLMPGQLEGAEESGSQPPEEAFEWTSYIAVRAVFDKLENSRRLARKLGRSRVEVEEDLLVIDLELERQFRDGDPSAWSDWEPVDIQAARDVLKRSAGFAPDVVPEGATDPVITMPLPMLAAGAWDENAVSHPQFHTGPTIDFDETLIRYLDFDVSPGMEYRYRVRIEFGADGTDLWTDWSEPTEAERAASGVWEARDFLNRSIARIEVDVEGDVRIGSGVVISTGEASREHGYQQLLTAAQLLKDFDSQRDTLYLRFFGEPEPRKWSAAYLDVDEESGLAVLCFEDPDLSAATASFGSLLRMPEIDDELTFHSWKASRAEFTPQRVVSVNRYAGPSNLECDGLPQHGDSAGGLFNERGELVGILFAADHEARRGVYHTLPAILEFLGIDESELADSTAGTPYGLPVTGTPIGLPGPPHIPLGAPAGLRIASGPGLGVLGMPARGAPEVILIALSSDNDGEDGEIHFLTDSLGTGDDALEQLSERVKEAARESAEAERTLQVQLSVDPRLKYEFVIQVLTICREQGVDDVRLTLPSRGADFVLNMGFVRDEDGQKLSETPVVFWRDEARSAKDLSSILEAERQLRPTADATLVLRADSEVAAGDVQEVIRQAQAAGFQKFVIRVLEAEPEQPGLQGAILDVLGGDTPGIVKISIGGDDGLRLQDQLDVYRAGANDAPGEFLGRIEVVLVDPDAAGARVIQSIPDTPIKTGDHVFWRVDPDRVQAAAPANEASVVLDGLVVSTRNQAAIVQISIGSDDGLKVNQQLDVYRGDTPEDRTHLGRIEIMHLTPDEAVARVIQTWAANPIQSGDAVIGPIAPDAEYPDPSRVISDAAEYVGPVVQLHLQQPVGMKLNWTDPATDETTELSAPRRFDVTPGTMTLELTEIPGQSGLDLRASIQIPVPGPATESYLDHNALPVQLTEEDLDQVASGNYLVKVIYLPDPEFQQVALAGIESLVTSRLDPGTDPVAEADRRGTILAVIRIGNRSAGGTEN